MQTVEERYNEETARANKRLAKFSQKDTPRAHKKVKQAQNQIEFATKLKDIRQREIKSGLNYMENEKENLERNLGDIGGAAVQLGYAWSKGSSQASNGYFEGYNYGREVARSYVDKKYHDKHSKEYSDRQDARKAYDNKNMQIKVDYWAEKKRLRDKKKEERKKARE